MKQKISITIEDEKIKIVEKLVEQGIFRNKSHALESGLNNLLSKQKLEDLK
jgi:Arc/MetJ-type ribon-helix-helix transcriptional regulator